MTKRSSAAFLLSLGWIGVGFSGDAGAAQNPPAPYRLEMPAAAGGPSHRIAITKDGILLGTLEIPASVGLSVEPKEQSLDALKAAEKSPLELRPNSDIQLGPHAPMGSAQHASIRVTGASFTLLRPSR